MPKVPGFIALISLVMLLSACSLAGDITPPPGSEQEPVQQVTQAPGAASFYPILPPDLANGATLYNRECLPCHGIRGMGDGPQSAQLSVPVAALGLSDFALQNSPADWYKIVSEGDMEHFMPSFTDLTDRERWDVVAYAMSLSTSEDMVNEGSQLYQENCSECHGLSGKGTGPSAANLPTPPRDITDQAYMAQVSSNGLFQVISAGISPHMPGFADLLDDEQRWAVVAFMRSLTYAAPASVAGAYPEPAAAVPGSTAYPAPETSPEPVVTPSLILTPAQDIPPSQPFTGTVAVELINGSGGEPPSNAEVTLYGFDDMQNTFSETLTTGVNGVYTFTNVYMPENRVFLAGTEYAAGTYGSDIVTVDPSNPSLDLQVTVFESTTDTSSLTTDRVHIFFDFSDPQVAQVIEVFIISNSSKQAIVAPTEDGTVVNFSLPEGYTNLQFQDGELGSRYVEGSQGFADRMTVNPGVGDYQVIFAFQMPYDRKLEFVQPMSLPTSAVVIMVPESGVKVDSNLLKDSGSREFQGSTYHMYDGGSLIAGSNLEFTLTGRPSQAGSNLFTAGTGQNLAIGLAVFGLVLVLVGVWLYRRNRLKPASPDVSAGDAPSALDARMESLPDDESTLMDAIIALDDQFQAGNLPENAYLERRSVLKDRLRQVNQG
jgi:mono/diheme cytochrome c family protein